MRNLKIESIVIDNGDKVMVDISIIVPIFNVEHYLARCVESILNQTHKNFELILVNDGSPDKCGEICEGYKLKDKRVKVIHQKNQGTGIARNNGLSLAVGKYVYFCDPDDYVEPTILEDNFNLAEKYQANMVLFGYYDEIYVKDSYKSIPRSPSIMFCETKEEFRKEFAKLHKKNMMYTLWNKLYKKKYLEDSQCVFGQEKVGQDTVFNYKVYENLDRVFIHDKKYYHYILNRPGSAVNRYRDGRFNIRYNETMKLEKLINCWIYQESFDELLTRDWYTTLFIGLDNIFYDNCPLNDNEKKVYIKKMLESVKIKELLRKELIKDFRLVEKCTVFLLRSNQITLFLYLMKIKKFKSKIIS